MAPSGHRRNPHPVILSSWHTGRSTGDSSTNKIGSTKHCSVRYNYQFKSRSIDCHMTYPAFIPRSRVVHWVLGIAEPGHQGSVWACEFFGGSFNNAADPRTLHKYS